MKIEKRFDCDTVTYGLKLMLIGLMKKVLIADRLAPHLDNIFASVQDASGAQLLLAGLLYPIELYADFSGYTDMAIGGAMMFGYRLSPNFNRPFVAKTITDFWRRWHMSLSFWVRDYLYQPIAASKRYWGQWGIVYALVVTFVLLGVWHGAGWNYVIYGLIQGLIISYEMVTVAYRNKVETSVGKHVFGVYSILRTYLLFAFSLLFFRLPSLSDAGYMISHLSFNLHTSIKELRLGMTDQECIVAGVAVVVLFLYEYFMSKRDLLQALSERHRIIRWGVYYLLVLLMFLFGQFGSEDFIYLQF
ncbi:MAG: MBOAT family O-acyltransferase [Butyricimonas paravirosa]